MAVQFLWLAVGIALLLAGGEAVVRGATGLARAMGVSPLIIGLTVVAFGTSAPELALNVVAAVNDRTEICFGNVIGSNLANIGLVVGAVYSFRPIRATGVVTSREIPMMLLATTATIIMGYDFLLADSVNRYDRGDGLILLLLFLVFLYYTVGDFVKFGKPVSEADAKNFWPHVGTTVLGFLALLAGADFTVDSAVAIATEFGVSDVIVGITVLAFGTSLPELVASTIAATKGQGELAIGNIVGSNIFNLLLVFGVTALVRPVAVPIGGQIDLVALAGFSLMLFLLSTASSRNLIRAQSAVMLAAYLGYITWRSTSVLS